MAESRLLLYHSDTVISESILEGEKVRLRPISERDLQSFVKWLADPEVTKWLAEMDSPPTLEEEHDWYEGKREDPDNVMWAVETLDGRLVGTTELRLMPKRRKAELGIVIMDKSAWSRGLGTDTVRLVVDYAFDELDLNRVELTTDEDNHRAIRCYEKVGFVREGLFRQHRLLDEKFGNSIAMAVLRDEWPPR
jgi:RimJ/RimL family protein N-acetyltransferase